MDFLRGPDKEFTEDISISLRDRDAWKLGRLKHLGLEGELAGIAYDVHNGVLAAGTNAGKIYVFGSPPATHCLSVPGAADAGIKHLSLAASATRLVTCDTKDKLHVWSFSSTGPPSLEGSLHVGDVVNCMITSLYHSHAFLGLKSGRVLTFDVDRLQFSPYTIPNAWQRHETVLRRSDVILSPVAASFDISVPPMVIDLAIHPRDLNLLLIGYERGIIIWNLSEQKATSHYSLSLLPGAPGAFLEPDRSPLLMEERCPPPTCIAWHPDGRLFAIGHMDGCISFWSVDEEDKPLDVRTVDRAGVHKVDFEAFAAAAALEPSDSAHLTYEPIYKLEWTPKFPGPNFATPSKGSYLTVLGGRRPTAPPGIPCMYFPAFVAPPNTTVSAEGLDSNPALRDALVASVTPTAYAEILSNPQFVVEDTVVVPEHNQILIIQSSQDGKRKLCVESHPPSAFVDAVASFTAIPDIEGSLPPPPQHVLDARPSGVPIPSRLPVELIMSDIVQAQLYVVSKSEVGSLVHRTVEGVFRQTNSDQPSQDVQKERLNWLRIGQAAPNTEGYGKMAKYEPSRIIVATHGDGVVRFYDTSSQLLLGPSPLRFEHPQPLPNLDIDPRWTISHPMLQQTLSASPVGGRMGVIPAHAHSQIRSVHFAPKALDCALVLAHGWVLLFQFTVGGTPVPFEVNQPLGGLVDIRPMSFEDDEKFRPVCLVAENMRGEVTCAALSDVGFVAIAYEDCSIMILDLRSLGVFGRYEPHLEQGKASAQDGPVRSFRWAQCALSQDGGLAIHLICITESGLTRVFTLSPPNHDNPNWSIGGQLKPVKHSSLAHPIFNTVIGLGSGISCAPTEEGIQQITAGLKTKDYSPSLWIAASPTRLRTHAGILGREVAHVDRKSGKEVIREAVMVTFEGDGEVTIYSLPRLERINNFSLGDSITRINSDSQGDFIATSDRGSLSIQTLADYSRAQPPLVDFSTPAPVIRDRPEPVDAGGIVSWLWSTKSKTGVEIDTCLAGPNRPPPRVKKAKYVPAGRAPNSPTAASSTARASAAAGPSDIYSRLTAAASERGQMLAGLEDKFAHLETASKDLASQAKRIAAQQSAKRWFGF